MHAQARSGPTRFQSYHSPKRQLVGARAGQPAPAWRPSNIPTGPSGVNGKALSSKKGDGPGSKIMLSHLPMDVVENEVKELFTRTIGPMKDLFLIYNSQGKSKGMAVVTFSRPGDAAIARAKYNNKLVDGRNRIKIEIILDSETPAPVPTLAAPAAPPSLLSRLGGTATFPPKQPPKQPNAPPVAKKMAFAPQPRPQLSNKTNVAQAAVGPNRRKQKKGPKRVKKSVAQLDKEMEDYRASAATL
ncbi:hypothetical protein EWM64_g6700 [Hericium alpestre]|uniref:RRM domain-containing protein n=1 Tax=Hericium alpestre TaxID=135208 RepID=A0A4Y9ZTF9_9AGAM|nr:hypothetical protein EWM64_g6700 [Hericium alpestre]